MFHKSTLFSFGIFKILRSNHFKRFHKEGKASLIFYIITSFIHQKLTGYFNEIGLLFIQLNQNVTLIIMEFTRFVHQTDNPFLIKYLMRGFWANLTQKVFPLKMSTVSSSFY